MFNICTSTLKPHLVMAPLSAQGRPVMVFPRDEVRHACHASTQIYLHLQASSDTALKPHFAFSLSLDDSTNVHLALCRPLPFTQLYCILLTCIKLNKCLYVRVFKYVPAQGRTCQWAIFPRRLAFPYRTRNSIHQRPIRSHLQ